MALFKKKSGEAQTPAAATDTATADTSTALDDFSDFSPDAISGAAPDNGSANGKGKGKKARAPKAEKKAPSGKAIKNGAYIGLNIGADSIKVVELTAKNGALSVTGMGMIPTPDESISNGVVMSVNALANGIRDAIAQAGIKSKKVVTSVSGTGALVVRIIEVPKMSDGELEDNMKMDADRYIPFPPSEVIMDFKALRDLPSDPDAMNMEVLLAAAQREIIDLHVQVLQDAKLDPRAIDVEPLAAARALTHPLTTGRDINAEADYNDVSAILNIGASATEISIMRGDLLVFTRTVPTAGAALTQALVDNLGLAWHDAEGLKRDMGDALPPHAVSTPAATAGFAADEFSDGTLQTGGDDDWSEFGMGDDAAIEDGITGGESADFNASAPTETTTGPVPEAVDPFDDAFFEQGPRNAEPGEQHQQKEPDAQADPEEQNLPAREGEVSSTEAVTSAAGSIEDETALPPRDTQSAATTPPEQISDDNLAALFRFDEIEEPDEDLPTSEENRPVDFNSLLGTEEDDFSDLPTLTTDAPASAPVPSAFDFPGESDFESDEQLPTVAGTTPGAGTPAGGEPIFGSTAIDAEEASLLPSEAQTTRTDAPANPFSFAGEAGGAAAAAAASTPATSDFSFDFAPPGETPTETLPTTAKPAGEDPFAAFDLGAGTATPAVSTPAPSPQATQPAARADDDFDLDSLFGETVATPATRETEPSNAPGTTVSGADLIGGDIGADLGADDFGDDFASFGAGLAGASASEIDAQTLYAILNPVLENLVAEVRRSLEYHTTRYPDAAVRRITLIGGGAKLTNIDAYFTQSLGIPTSLGNAAANLEIRAPRLPPSYVEENGPLFAVAIGLAMRELTR